MSQKEETARKLCATGKRPKRRKAANVRRAKAHPTTAQALKALAEEPEEEAEVLGVELTPATCQGCAHCTCEDGADAGAGAGAKEMYDGEDPEESMAMPASYYGPTSLEDLGAMRDAQMQAAQVQQTTGDFQAVVANIMADPRIEDKGAAIEQQAGVLRQMLSAITQGAQKALHALGIGKKEQPAPTPAPVQPQQDLGGMCDTARQHGGAFAAFKTRYGDYRWLGVFSNRFEDRQGETIPEGAHKEFCAYLDAHPAEAPEWWTWHTDVGRKARADFWDYCDGFVFIGGPCSEEQAAPYIQNPAPRGMSHGFYSRKAGKTIEQYRSFEVSDLPPDEAANQWTDFTVIAKEVGMPFSEQKRAYLVGLFGEDKVKELEAAAAAGSKALMDAGVAFKALQEEQPAQTQNASALAPAAPAVDGQAFEALTQQVKALSDVVAQIGGAVVTLSKSMDERVAEAIAPRSAPPVAGVRASAAEATTIPADHPAAQQAQKDLDAAGPSWLAQGLGVRK